MSLWGIQSEYMFQYSRTHYDNKMLDILIYRVLVVCNLFSKGTLFVPLFVCPSPPLDINYVSYYSSILFSYYSLESLVYTEDFMF